VKVVNKYDNLSETFPKLRTVLCDAIQSEFLDIKKIKSGCKHYEDACSDYPPLKDAVCVIYSPFMRKCDHAHETFIFIDSEGEETCHISGREMELYGMLEPMIGLKESEEYSKIKVNFCV
jgi:precorrin-3B methylase